MLFSTPDAIKRERKSHARSFDPDHSNGTVALASCEAAAAEKQVAAAAVILDAAAAAKLVAAAAAK